MRGVSFNDTNLYLAQSVLMSKYNQQYSEIENIPVKTVMFLLCLAEAEGQYQESEMKKAQAKIKNKRR